MTEWFVFEFSQSSLMDCNPYHTDASWKIYKYYVEMVRKKEDVLRAGISEPLKCSFAQQAT